MIFIHLLLLTGLLLYPHFCMITPPPTQTRLNLGLLSSRHSQVQYKHHHRRNTVWTWNRLVRRHRCRHRYFPLTCRSSSTPSRHDLLDYLIPRLNVLERLVRTRSPSPSMLKDDPDDSTPQATHAKPVKQEKQEKSLDEFAFAPSLSKLEDKPDDSTLRDSDAIHVKQEKHLNESSFSPSLSKLEDDSAGWDTRAKPMKHEKPSDATNALTSTRWVGELKESRRALLLASGGLHVNDGKRKGKFVPPLSSLPGDGYSDAYDDHKQEKDKLDVLNILDLSSDSGVGFGSQRPREALAAASAIKPTLTITSTSTTILLLPQRDNFQDRNCPIF
ncbi:hypothetical protein BDP27DRAFT_1455009 [Rhodocollybia butyracea]|uniref:Uncharacterized protein n=1 Tax=Rhodocollybia butyracea TaxID=206335 RepID=A0A9P5TWT0_9AGAR|nr:hypothetical protein BDP27DRAFT_1455009 [Rhodocollybia butyracea]